MTCHYSPQSPLDALYIAARKYPGGIEALAPRLDVSAQTLYKMLRRDVTTHRLSFDLFEQIIDLLSSAGMADAAAMPLQALCWSQGHVAVRLPTCGSSAETLMEQVVVMFREGGDVAGAIKTAAGDGSLTARGADNIYTQIREAQEALAGLAEMVRAMRSSVGGTQGVSDE